MCVHRDTPTIPLGSLCVHRDVLAHKPPIKMSPTTLLPHPGFYVFILHILEETARPGVCARQVRGSILQNFCSLVAYLCRVVSLRHSSGRVRLVAPPRVYVCICMDSAGPTWTVSPLPRIFMVWEAWRRHLYVPPPETLACAAPRWYSVDSRVWLTSTRTYIAFAVPFMVQIHSGLGGWVELLKRQQQQQ